MQIDHVILATRDLHAAAGRLLGAHGLGSVAGGEHPAWGTANRIVAAGRSYVELMGVRDHAAATANDLGRWVLARSADGDRLGAVCLSTDDLDGLCDRLGITPFAASRVRPDGSTLRWRMAGLEQMTGAGLPFFIAWDGPSGADVPDPEEGEWATALTAVELGGDVDELRAWIGADVVGLRLVGGEPGVRSVTLATSRGDIRL